MTRFLFALAALSIPLTASGDDWPQWRGPNRSDVSKETGLLQSWPEGGPDQLWTNDEGGLGYAGFAVAKGKLVTMGMEDQQEFVICIDAKSGKTIWKTNSAREYKNGWGNGPRSTPTVVGDHVYCMFGKGKLACFKMADGEEVWSKSMTEDFGGQIQNWGFTESVLVDGDKVVCTPGGNDGAIVALNRKTGETIWRSTDFTDQCQYASLVKAKINGVTQYIQLTKLSVVAISAEDGSVVWKTKWPGATAVIPTPIVKGNRVYITSGYRVGSAAFEIGADNSVKQLWKNKVMVNHHGGVIERNGLLFGFSDTREIPGIPKARRGSWICQDMKTGDAVWGSDKLQKGAIAYADNRFYLLAERSGTVALIDATDAGYKERGRFKLEPQSERRSRRGAIWVHPVISNGRMYLRDQEIIHCYDVAAGKKTASAEESDWVQLFNGKNLDGWTPKIRHHKLGENFADTFRVEDGVIKVSYDNYDGPFKERFGHLFYNEPFSDYVLRVEYRFVGNQIAGGPGWAFRNSGLMLHGEDPAGMSVDQDFPKSIEVQLLGGDGKSPRNNANLCTPGTNVVYKGGLFKPHCTKSSSKTYHGDDWVTVEVEVRGNRVMRHKLDGEVVLEYFKPQYDPRDEHAKKLADKAGTLMLSGGTISLQSESHPCEFRKVELKKLPASE